MLQVGQHNASVACEFGIQPQYLDRERDFVDDALAGPVAGRKQFKIFRTVVSSNSVYVMNSFFGQKFTSDFLFHYIPMFQYFVSSRTISSWNSKHSVASFDAARDFWVSMPRTVNLANPFVFTLLAAKFLGVVDRARTFAASFVKFTPAVFACRLMALISIFTASDRRTGSRTIQRFPAKLLTICRNVRLHHIKGIAAFAANKGDRCNASRRSPVQRFVRSHACTAAKLSIRVLGLDSVGGVAVFTNFFNRHGETPVDLTIAGVARAGV